MDPERARELLARARAETERALSAVDPRHVTEDAEGDVLDRADMGDSLLEKEIDVGLADELHERLAAIERAENRLAEGKYGLSVDSGEPIPDGRLEIIPWAERTAAEQERLGR
jgi:RNA polymerase-binding transcription factor